MIRFKLRACKSWNEAEVAQVPRFWHNPRVRDNEKCRRTAARLASKQSVTRIDRLLWEEIDDSTYLTKTKFKLEVCKKCFELSLSCTAKFRQLHSD